MADLVIANPAAAHGIYGPLGNELVAVEQPLWARLIAGYVEDQGFDVAIVDAEAIRSDAQATASAIALGSAPELICIAVYGHQPSASTQQMWGAGLLARALRKEMPKVPLIMVGGHPSALPERTLREEEVDYVGVGEGPATIVGLLRGDPVENIPGLVWWKDDEVARNPSPPLMENLNHLHGDAWSLLPMHLYRSHNWQVLGDLGRRQPYASIYTSLGCPHACRFCCINAPFASNRYRMRNPATVVDEIEYLYEDYGVSTFKVTDEMFILNRRHYTEICRGLIDRGLGPKLNVWAYARVDTVRPDTLEMLKAAGFCWLALGIESGSKHVRDGAEKELRTDDIVGVVKAVQAAGINVIGNFIVGLPDDTTETMEQTFQLATECNCEFMNIYAAQAYPGSSLYNQAVKEGWTLPDDWSGYSQHNRRSRPLDTRSVNGREVLRFRDEFFQRYFSSAQYQNMIANKFGSDAVSHIRRMLDYKLDRDLLESAT